MSFQFLRRILSSLALLATLVAGPALAHVNLRVEARPATDPIQTYVRVTDANGDPVTGLMSASFTLSVDGVDVPLQSNNLTLPSSEDPNQHVSVVFVMDYTSSVTAQFLVPLQTAVIEFINAMNVGDQVAIIKFNNDSGANVVAAFTAIDGVGNPNNLALEAAVMADYPGDGSNILDAIGVGVQLFTDASATLPEGPKAVIVVTDGKDTHSTSTSDDVIGSANANSIPIFTIGVGDPDQDALDLMDLLAVDTGGQFIPTATEQDIADAYASVSLLLTSEYLITFANAITDCAEHVLEVTVTGQAAPASVNFTRRTCDTVPDPFTFTAQNNVTPGEFVNSNTVTINGIEPGVPAHISVIAGSYSIGCTSNFTLDPATIDNGDTVCVRQQASAQPSTSKTTTLTIGSVPATFTTTTRAASGGGGGGGGGGGATGLLELMFGIGALLLRRRRTA